SDSVYGITVDAEQRVWLGGGTRFKRYNPMGPAAGVGANCTETANCMAGLSCGTSAMSALNGKCSRWMYSQDWVSSAGIAATPEFVYGGSGGVTQVDIETGAVVNRFEGVSVYGVAVDIDG